MGDEQEKNTLDGEAEVQVQGIGKSIGDRSEEYSRPCQTLTVYESVLYVPTSFFASESFSASRANRLI